MGFNEAPAQSWGKRCKAKQQRKSFSIASMRPQRKAGENPAGIPTARKFERASMRPQRKAGENLRLGRARDIHARASMRPQRKAGENFKYIDWTDRRFHRLQ